MKPKNMLFIFSDEHTREITGCYGNQIVKTPNIDKLAQNGTRFDNAYTNCPICVPARASLATGRYVHEIGNWDNAHPYTGETKGWGHRLQDEDHNVTAIGKLHYRAESDDNGFADEVNTLHVVDGKGDLLGLSREKMVERGAVKQLAAEAGLGDSTYIRYDVSTAQEAVRWLEVEAPKQGDKPWCLFVGFVLPHFPLIAPQKYYDMYPENSLPWPRMYRESDHIKHPVIKTLSTIMAYDDYFTEEKVRMARSAYFGMVSMLDYHVGQVLDALNKNGHGDSTRIVYTSDHGDNLGHRGLWGKSVMYEEAAAVPMIVAGPDIPAGHVVTEPVSLVDCHQTIVECAGLDLTREEEHDMPGHSLIRMANGEKPERTVLSEYHAAASPTAMLMIRNGKWKYTHYVGERPELYDLESDPFETTDLGESSGHKSILQDCEAKLRDVVNPEVANAQAFADQKAKIEANGGLETIKSRGDFGYTPAPGQTPLFD
jgi:choline-sulfatase